MAFTRLHDSINQTDPRENEFDEVLEDTREEDMRKLHVIQMQRISKLSPSKITNINPIAVNPRG